MFQEYAPLIGLAAVGFLLAGIMLTFSILIAGKSRKTNQKEKKVTAFSSYFPAKYRVYFYPLALAFLLLNSALILLYPLVTVLSNYGWNGFFLISIFIFFLALVYLYCWRKGAFKWGENGKS